MLDPHDAATAVRTPKLVQAVQERTMITAFNQLHPKRRPWLAHFIVGTPCLKRAKVLVIEPQPEASRTRAGTLQQISA